MILMIDNYDSFTYNLVQAFMVLGAEVQVYRNDEISVEQAQFGQAAADYQTTLNFLENRIGGIRKALKGD